MNVYDHKKTNLATKLEITWVLDYKPPTEEHKKLGIYFKKSDSLQSNTYERHSCKKTKLHSGFCKLLKASPHKRRLKSDTISVPGGW